MPDKAFKLRIGLPKGSLQESTFKIFEKAGFSVVLGSRSYFPYIDDVWETLLKLEMETKELR